MMRRLKVSSSPRNCYSYVIFPKSIVVRYFMAGFMISMNRFLFLCIVSRNTMRPFSDSSSLALRRAF